MKNIILALLLISFLAFPVIGLATLSENPPRLGCRAQAVHLCEPKYGNFCWWDPTHIPEGETDPTGKCRDRAPKIDPITGIGIVGDIIFTILIAVAALFVMIGAFMFVTAGGDAEKVAAAREKILYAVIAVVVAILSWGIINFIKDAF